MLVQHCLALEVSARVYEDSYLYWKDPQELLKEICKNQES